MPQSVRGIGAGGGIRTRGILLGGQALFQLSYARSGCPAQSLLKSSKPVAVRADDIALAGLNQHPIRTPADHPGDTADLGRRIPMVEVHLMSGELTPAIGAGNLAKLPQECRGRGLSTPDALDFACPIARVVANVCRPLVTCFGHVLF